MPQHAVSRRGVLLLTILLAELALLAQTTSPVAIAPAPRFDVVSIKRNVSGAAAGSSSGALPGGGYRVLNGPVRALIAPAFDEITGPPEGLPDWVTTDRYDIIATASLSGTPTLQDRETMIRAMLVERFNFAAHFEMRNQPAFDLVVARRDGRLGPGLKPTDVDCSAVRGRGAGTAAPPPSTATPGAPPPVPPCSMRLSSTMIEGDMPISMLLRTLRTRAGAPVVDKTGLTGSYRVRLDLTRVAADTAASPTAQLTDNTQTIFSAVVEQLGLKLEPSTAPQRLLVVDRIERPTEN